MTITTEEQDGVIILSLQGRLDTNTSEEVQKVVMNQLDQGNATLVFNLEELEYISSAGLRVLLMALKKVAGASGKLGLYGLKPYISEIFEIAGFEALFEIFDTKEAALKGIK
jgi:anti-sigma B factor antagonist